MRREPAQQLAQASRVLCHALARAGRAPVPAPILVHQGELSMLLAEPPHLGNPAALASWRGGIDALAARARYSDPRVHAACAPAGELARKLFDLLEQNRVEALASRDFPGMRNNLAALYHDKWHRARPDGAIRGVGTGWIETFALLARPPLGAPLPDVSSNVLGRQWHSWMTLETAAALRAMAHLLNQQEQFARQSLQIIRAELQPETESLSLRRSGDPRGGLEQTESTRQHAAPLRADERESSTARRVESGEHQSAADGEPRQASPDEPTYEVYTTQFDRVSQATDLRDAVTLERRRRELDQQASASLATVARWAHRLQRRLLAMQLRSWKFDCEEGVLDASRLVRIATCPLEPLAYKQETDSEFPGTIVSLLVDNSGSMRGAPMRMAAACAEILGRVLERGGVKTEILGFTTQTWGGGKARRKWVTDGSPPHPGRLAELQHVIYKSADEPWRRARRHLGLMLEDDLLKENIDGEALLWAADRLRQRIEPRRILIVICDGAPLDEATLAANAPEFLDRHLRSVIEWLERCAPLELLAIGIGHDVNAYYRRAVKLDSLDQLGEALVIQLSELLASPRRRPMRKRREKK
jgi:cobaltochelatase CobT